MAAKDSRANVIEGRFNSEYQSKLVGEVADLWFHSLVLLGQFELSSKDVLAELSRREGLSGIVEKESRTTE
jgi:phosphoribosyl-ATP pyrophosphohydrolase